MVVNQNGRTEKIMRRIRVSGKKEKKELAHRREAMLSRLMP